MTTTTGEYQPHRLLLHSGEVIDGTGRLPYRSEVLIEDGAIRALLQEPDAERLDADRIDCTGQMIAPGFIDTHAHDDLALLKPDGVQPKLLQGVTVDVIGNCGHGCAPVSRRPASQAAYSAPVLGSFPTDFADSPPWQSFGEYLNRLAANPLGTNAVALVAHGALRAAVAGQDRRPLAEHELDRACGLLREGLDRGAAGLSLGLMYAPGNSATRDELMALARTLATHKRILAVHLRSEGDDIRSSLTEMLQLARETGVALHLSHLKVVSPKNHGRMPELLNVLDDARADGLDVTADVYPYAVGSTTVSAMFPGWALSDGVPGLLTMLADQADRRRIIADLRRPWNGMENNILALGGGRIVLAGFDLPDHQAYEGSTLAAIAADRSVDPVECLCDLVLTEHAGLTVVLHQMSEDDVESALSWPWSMIGSDGLPIDRGYTHPRMYGTFPRVLDRYAGRGRIFDLPGAIQRMTQLPAHRFGLRDRGELAPGQVADVVTFDPSRLSDRATFSEPRQHPEGIRTVLVNGHRAVADGRPVRHAGALLRAGTDAGDTRGI